MSEKGKVYDYATGEFTTVERSIKATHDRVRWELLKKRKETEPPAPGYGIDGYPLQRPSKK